MPIFHKHMANTPNLVELLRLRLGADILRQQLTANKANSRWLLQPSFI